MALATRNLTNTSANYEPIIRQYVENDLAQIQEMIVGLGAQNNHGARQANQFSRLAKAEKIGKLYSLIVLADNEEEEEEYLDADESLVDAVSEEVQAHISLNALSGVSSFQTMGVIGLVAKQHELHILIDLGSTHNFVDVNMAKRMGCKVWSTCPLAVSVLGRKQMVTFSECKDFQWQLYGYTFTADVMLLPLGECDMVLVDDDDYYPNTGLHLMTMEETVPIKVKVEPRLQEVIDAHAEVFAVPNKLPPMRTQDHRIPLMPGTQPVNIRPYRHPPVQKDAIEAMVRELLDSGVIKHSQSSFASPVVMVKKKDNSWRMCVDYRQLNKHTIKDKFSIPIIKELIDELCRAVIFNKLDLMFGYHQDESKCVFGTTHVEYLGHMLFAEGVATDPTKIQAMQSWLIPTTIKQLRGFLGLSGYYRRFIRDFASISRPLTQLLNKNSFKWNNEAQQAFIFLKEAMIQALVLALPKFNKPFVVETDASSIWLGEILQQKGNPIAYMSKSLGPKQQALSTYAKEFLAVLMALEKWRGYLLDMHFVIKTDHYSLKENQIDGKSISTESNGLVTQPGENLEPDYLEWAHKLVGEWWKVTANQGGDGGAFVCLVAKGGDGGACVLAW
ncbi:reverse transcriptase [Tanacetum coccineum]